MRIEPLYQEFLTYLSVERNCSPLTVTAYQSDGRLFLESLADQALPAETESITRLVVRQYIVWLRNRGLKPSSVARRIHSLRSFWNYLWDSDYTNTNPFRKLTLPKRSRDLPVYLSEEECRRLLEGAGDQPCSFCACRDRAILTLMIFTGARRSEVLALTWPNVDLEQGTVRFVGAKGDKTRVVPLAVDAADLLREWRELRPSLRLYSEVGGTAGKEGADERIATGPGWLGDREVQRHPAQAAALVRVSAVGQRRRPALSPGHARAHATGHDGDLPACHGGRLEGCYGEAPAEREAGWAEEHGRGLGVRLCAVIHGPIYLHMDAVHLHGAVERHPLAA